MLGAFLEENNLLGLALGLSTFFIIGLFHPIVIKAEYYFGVKCWWWFLVAGMVLCFVSWLVTAIFWSALCAVSAFSCFWSILEIFHQRERVRKGWFPKNPSRKD